MSETDIREERIRKLDLLKEAGMAAYPVTSGQTKNVQEFLAHFDTTQSSASHDIIVGRIMALRGQGGIQFLDLFDGTARAQVVFQKDDMKPTDYELFSKTVDVGDFIEVTGVAYLTRRGEKSLKAATWRMLSKSILPIPDSWFGLKDEELKLRERYLSILMDPELRAVFERRARFWQTIRNFYLEKGFLEVETPVLETTPGGAEARPFITHHNALDIDVYLRISAGELWQKRLLVAGFAKVFEIGRIFRNEGQSREHLQDYVQWESYEAFKDMSYGMPFVQELYRRIAKDVYGRLSFTIHDHNVDMGAEWQQLHFCDLIREKFKIDPLTCSEAEAIATVENARIKVGERLNKARAIDHLWKSIRKGIAGPAFLTGIPDYLEPLAKRTDNDPRVVERFQVLIAGSEVGKGFSELNDPIDQRLRFETQQSMRDAGDDEAQRLDEEYVRAMEYGMPPAFGFGMSERLFSFLESKPVHEAQIFPLLRPKQ